MATQFRNCLEPGVQMLPRDQGHIRGSILLFIRKWLIKLVYKVSSWHLIVNAKSPLFYFSKMSPSFVSSWIKDTVRFTG